MALIFPIYAQHLDAFLEPLEQLVRIFFLDGGDVRIIKGKISFRHGGDLARKSCVIADFLVQMRGIAEVEISQFGSKRGELIQRTVYGHLDVLILDHSVDFLFETRPAYVVFRGGSELA